MFRINRKRSIWTSFIGLWLGLMFLIAPSSATPTDALFTAEEGVAATAVEIPAFSPTAAQSGSADTDGGCSGNLTSVAVGATASECHSWSAPKSGACCPVSVDTVCCGDWCV